MSKLRILLICFITYIGLIASAQVKIRLFSDKSPESAVFSVTKGKYEISAVNGEKLTVIKGEPVIITRYHGRLAVKKREAKGFLCDSVLFEGKTGDDYFSLRLVGNIQVRQYYSGDLRCFPDLGTLVLINISDVEKYISGVVMAEGGSGRNIEYFKTQAVIARTYLYRYFDKHTSDRYNVCDNTHCQAFNGLSSDTIINNAALETRGIVILAPDSTLIISAFHSNCGGETSSSEDVWLSSQPYLKRTVDPYCLSSRNSTWKKSISLIEWIDFLAKSGYKGETNDPSGFSFVQKSRMTDYRSGSFTMPLRTIRNEMNLRSTFFSVLPVGDSIIFSGKGYGHGVGLCQEGAMEMAAQGYNYNQVVNFYYFGVFLSDIKNAVILPQVAHQPSQLGLPPTPP